MQVDDDGGFVAPQGTPAARRRRRAGVRAVVPIAVVALVGTIAAGMVVLRPLGNDHAGSPAAQRPQCGNVPDGQPVNTDVPQGNPVEVLRRGHLPSLPETGAADAVVLGLRRYVTVEQYMTRSHVMMPDVMREAMAENGLIVAETIGYQAGPASWGAEAFHLGSATQAADFARRLLLAECEAGVAAHIAPVPGLLGATTYTYHSWDFPAFRATLVLGDTVVLLNGCVCQPGRVDPRLVLDSWVRNVHLNMRSAVA
ncbi:MAG: hypothetical protein QOD63_1595 [Actinomycetota bacterium]|jgi:hypothetical protein|nr:hypothetical protein [Actinomycetota bacterium]